MRDKQACVRAGLSYIDKIITLRIIAEQSLELQSPFNMKFTDNKRRSSWCWTLMIVSKCGIS